MKSMKKEPLLIVSFGPVNVPLLFISNVTTAHYAEELLLKFLLKKFHSETDRTANKNIEKQLDCTE